MSQTLRKIFLLIFLVACLDGLALSEERLTGSRLRTLGVNSSSLQPITFSHNDRYLAAFDRAEFEEKKEGTFYRLWFFEIGRDGTLGQARSVPLELKNLQQGEFTPDDKQFIVIGNRGTTFLSIDMSTYRTSALLEPQWGQAGFRADPAVLWTESGKLFVAGRPYDKERFVETQTVATFRPQAPPEQRFVRGGDLSTLEQGLDRLWFSNYVNDTKAFFGQKYPEVTLLSFWNGSVVSEFDRAWKFLGFWGNAGRLLYSAKRSQGQDCELVLYDSNTNTKTLIGQDKTDYRYLFLSRDGKTALTPQMEGTDRRLIPWDAHESEGWKLKPVLVDSRGVPRTVSSGWIRLSSQGKLMCHVGESGLAIYPLR